MEQQRGRVIHDVEQSHVTWSQVLVHRRKEWKYQGFFVAAKLSLCNLSFLVSNLWVVVTLYKTGYSELIICSELFTLILINNIK